MKVEIKVLPEAKEPYAVIYASEITPEIRRTAALLETKNSGVVSVMENERIIVLRPDEIYMVRVENEKTVVYTKTKRHDGGKRLYEFEEILGKGFMRISKGTLANLHYLDNIGRTDASCFEKRLQGVHLTEVSARFQTVFRIIRRCLW